MSDSTKRILPSNAKYYALDSILPEHLRQNSRFIEFLNTYFEWMQLDETSPTSVINRLNDYRNIDLINENFIKHLELEYAVSIPSNLPDVDKRKLYKQLNDIYRARGSIPAFEALFNLLYGDEIELYYPRVDLMKLSDGKWNAEDQRYLNKGSFLSNYNYIQDSYYYQDYSYVIKTRKPYDQWQATVRKMVHPTGFALFGKVSIVSQATVKRLKSPKLQPGTTFTSNNFVIPLYSPVVIATTKVVETTSFLQTTYLSIVNTLLKPKFGPNFALLDKIKFLIGQRIGDYKNFTLAQAKNGSPFNILPNSSITVTSI
jgi:hypothetical protein